MGKTDLFTQFYPTGFTQWVKVTVPTLCINIHDDDDDDDTLTVVC